ncbi:MAG: hypothetical protein PHS82_12480 [Lachnospiraceae bacterium]|nr:hypothetical protein [Lachnospiraceae bacterium]
MEDKLAPGYEVGHLTLVEPTSNRENGYIVWKCACDCGNSAYVSSKKLKRQTIISCGCVNGFRKKNQNPIGRQIGMLTVDEISEKKTSSGKCLWHLICECGGETWMTTGDINREKKRHCGCQSEYNMVDLNGFQSGELSVLRPTVMRTKQGSVMWECKCTCGRTVIISSNALIHKKQKSCGCKKKERMKLISSRLHRVDGTCIERLGQKAARPESHSGICGVGITPQGHYYVHIGIQGKRYRLGTYRTLPEAVQIREQAVQQMHLPLMQKYHMESAANHTTIH